MINPVLFNLYGPLSIHIYGLCIVIGVLIAFLLMMNDKKIKKLISTESLVTSFQLMLISGYIGGRLGSMISDPDLSFDPSFLLRFWEPGLSILGTVIGVSITISIYFKMKNFSMLQILDRAAIYAPIAQSLGRVGCFFTGCCYGIPTNSFLRVIYNHPNHAAPLNCNLHPTQLYSSIILLSIFLFLYFIQQHRSLKKGQLFLSYIILISIERFLIDFIRWDRIFITEPYFFSSLSVHQWIAISLCLIATFFMFFIQNKNK